jgi:uncharacterized protein YprB with RNaseH-like and TPR domain
MLDHSFIFLPNFGPAREKKLWRHGILSWDDFLDSFGSSPFHNQSCSILASSRHALKNNDPAHFAKTLQPSETWRCFPHYKKMAYLDIETTGCTANDYLTVIGVYDGKKTRSYVQGDNLNDFQQDIKNFDMVVTFNGSLFDLPFIRRSMDADLPDLHVDLRFVLASLDVRGGLKKIEEQFGFEREDDLKGVTGYDAVLMWRDFKRGNKAALEKLIRYNAADVDNLEKLLVWAYKEKRKRTGFDEIRKN